MNSSSYLFCLIPVACIIPSHRVLISRALLVLKLRRLILHQEAAKNNMKLTRLLFSRFIQNPFITKVRAGTRYMFHRHLLLTNLGISASLSATGDVLQQNYEMMKSPDRKYSLRRTFNMSLTGITVGLVCHHWYNWLDKFLPGRTLLIALKKMLMDQIICSPITISTFFVTLALVEKSSADEFADEFKSKSWRLYLAEWVIWPGAQMINFFFLPTRFRVLYDNTISLGYDVYTSYVKHEIPNDSEINSENQIQIAQSSSTFNLPATGLHSPQSL